MFSKPKVARLKKEGPAGVLRIMRENGVEHLPVVRTNRTFLGYVKLTDVLRLKKESYNFV